MTPTQPDYNSLISHIRSFCHMIRALDTYSSGTLLADLFQVLSLISREMERLNAERDGHFFALPDLDFRFEMFCRLLEFLAPYLRKDHPAQWESVAGNLADDLTDLYFELQRGLELLDRGEGFLEPALSLWRTGYELHWKTHLESALQQLAKYSSRCFN